MRVKRTTYPLLGVFFLLLCTPVRADQVPPAYISIASQYQLPADVVYAIALTESGRSTKDQYRPWPWTLNVGGAPKFYPDRASALSALEHAIAQNIKPLGVGLMQIEWPIHHARVSHPAEMLDPYTNLELGAQILVEYGEKRDLWSAVGRYHSATPHLASAYRNRVAKRLINFLARALPTNDALPALSYQALP